VSLIAIPAGLPHSWLARGGLAIIAVGVAAALSVATLRNPKSAQAVVQGLSAGIQSVKTVAAMLAERSPGERPEGALANLKPKRQAVLHQRALPKVRAPAFPAYEALAGPPPSPLIALPPEVPLYSTVAGGPPVALPLTTAATPGTPGGPPVLSNIPLPGGGGGGIFSPPTTAATPDVPSVPVTPVPEPATWAMMILGFALMGRMLRRRATAGPEPARE
jgi:hypothetical protein